MATLKMATGSVLDTVVNTANSVSGLVNAGARSVDMLNDFVTTAQVEQKLRNKAKLSNLPTVIKEDIARENVIRRIELSNWLNTDSRLEEMYSSALAELDHIFENQK